MARVICLGTIVLDRVFAVDAIPAAPTKVTARAVVERGGGIAATAAVAIAALGGDAAYWGRIGTDPVGDALLAALRRHRVATDAVRRIPGAQSSTAAVLLDRAGERLIAAFPGSGLDPDPSWLPLGDVVRAQAVLVDFRWPEGAEALLAAAARAGLPRVLDADVGNRAVTERLLPQVDHAIFSAPGLAEIAGTPAPEEGLRRVQQRVPGCVGVTLGAEGFLWLEAGRACRAPGFAVAVADTTGSGDAFHGAYALGLAEGMPVATAARLANAAAAIKCARGAGWDGMADRAATAALMEGQA